VTHRFLVADDSALARVRVREAMVRHGVEVVEAASLAEGRRVDATPLCCALLDLDLGDGCGVTLAAALRETRPELPVAFFSSGADAATTEAARAFGPVFEKPAQLDAAIAWALAATKPRA
jgi:ActR/RegA family two-component response regulator